MTGFVYKWTNQINGRWYIGSHKGTIDDGYRHSSKILAAAEKKYGIENFIRKILFVGDYEKDQIRSSKESEYLREEDAVNNPMSYNLSNITGPNCFSKERNQKISKQRKGQLKSKETRRKMSRAKIGNTHGRGNKGNTLSKERRQHLSKIQKGVPLGPQSKEHIEKRAKKLRNYIKTAEHRKNLSIAGKGNINGRGNKGKQNPHAKANRMHYDVTCPYCSKIGMVGNMTRWHFDNCKQYKLQ